MSESGRGWLVFRGHVENKWLRSWKRWLEGFLEEVDFTLNRKEVGLSGEGKQSSRKPSLANLKDG